MSYIPQGNGNKSEKVTNSKAVKEFARRLEELKSSLDRSNISDVGGSESSSTQTQRFMIDHIFNTVVVPRFRTQFWSMVGVNPSTPGADLSVTNENRVINDIIFPRIKGLILTAILSERGTTPVLSNWIRTNWMNLISCDYTSEAVKTVMEGARVFFHSKVSLNHIAWRNFDPLAERDFWTNLFVGNDLTGGGRDHDIRKRLAYYYLVATDVSTQGNVIVPESTLANRIAIFIEALASCRRGHNDCSCNGNGSQNVGRHSTRCPAIAKDSPSCATGAYGRMGTMGGMHPLCQLPPTMSAQIQEIARTLLQESLTTTFRNCINYDEKLNTFDALMELHQGNTKSILEDKEIYSESLFKRRIDWLERVGIYKEGSSGSLALLRRIVDRVNTQLANSGLISEMRHTGYTTEYTHEFRYGILSLVSTQVPTYQAVPATLDEAARKRMILMLADPAGTPFAQQILERFKASLTPSELNLYNKSVSQQSADTSSNSKLRDEYNRLMKEEKEAEENSRPKSSDPNVLASHRKHYSPLAVRKRIIEALYSISRSRNRIFGTTLEQVRDNLAVIEDEMLIEEFNSTLKSVDDLFKKENQGFKLKRTFKTLVKGALFDFDLLEDEELNKQIELMEKRYEETKKRHEHEQVRFTISKPRNATLQTVSGTQGSPRNSVENGISTSTTSNSVAQNQSVSQTQITDTSTPQVSSTSQTQAPSSPQAQPNNNIQNAQNGATPAGCNPASEARLAQNLATALETQTIRYQVQQNGQTVELAANSRRLVTAGMQEVQVYRRLHLPRMPVIHPYHPEGGGQAYERTHNGIPIVSVAAAIPRGTIGNLPFGAAQMLVQANINIDYCDVFFCIQNIPWNITQERPLLYRPHPWLHSDAPEQGNYNVTENVDVAIADINGQFQQLTRINGVSTHTNDQNNVVYSAQQMAIPGAGSHQQSHAFYSLCINPGTHRAALTLHWLVNDTDNNVIQNQIIPQCNTLHDFINFAAALPNSRLNQAREGSNESPAEALLHLVSGGHPQPVAQSVYQLQEVIGGSSTPTTNTHSGSQTSSTSSTISQSPSQGVTQPTVSPTVSTPTSAETMEQRLHRLKDAFAAAQSTNLTGSAYNERYMSCYRGVITGAREMRSRIYADAMLIVGGGNWTELYNLHFNSDRDNSTSGRDALEDDLRRRSGVRGFSINRS